MNRITLENARQPLVNHRNSIGLKQEKILLEIGHFIYLKNAKYQETKKSHLTPILKVKNLSF